MDLLRKRTQKAARTLSRCSDRRLSELGVSMELHERQHGCDCSNNRVARASRASATRSMMPSRTLRGRTQKFLGHGLARRLRHCDRPGLGQTTCGRWQRGTG